MVLRGEQQGAKHDIAHTHSGHHTLRVSPWLQQQKSLFVFLQGLSGYRAGHRPLEGPSDLPWTALRKRRMGFVFAFPGKQKSRSWCLSTDLPLSESSWGSRNRLSKFRI